jgi:hypothetical protein
MPLLQKGTKFAARRMPDIIDPRLHAVLDYAVAAGFFLKGALLWKRRRRAAAGALICGGATLANALVTDYPGGVFPKISYRTHGRNDAAIAAFTASAPRLLGFAKDDAERFFSMAAVVETAVTELTNYDLLLARNRAA